MYKIPSNKRLVKVSDHPPTWLELDKNLTKEQIQSKIDEYNANNRTLDDMINEGYFDSLKEGRTHDKYVKTAIEEVHVPHRTNSGVYYE